MSKEKPQKRSHPITPYDRQYRLRDIINLHPAEKTQRFLDSHQMSMLAQTSVYNDWQLAIGDWENSLPI